MNWNPLFFLLSIVWIVGGIILIVLQRQKFVQTTAVLSECTCYNQADVCICNGTYSFKGDTFESGIPTLPGGSKDGDKVRIFVDTSNPYAVSKDRPALETVGYVLVGLGVLQVVFSVLKNLL